MSATPSSRPGMGTILYNGGAAFRVWAPFADSVSVAGDFNAWSATAAPLAHEGNGYWSADIPAVAIGHQYLFVIQNGVQQIWRRNPYASEVVNSSGNAIVHDPRLDWSGDHFQIPHFCARWLNIWIIVHANTWIVFDCDAGGHLRNQFPVGRRPFLFRLRESRWSHGPACRYDRVFATRMAGLEGLS